MTARSAQAADIHDIRAKVEVIDERTKDTRHAVNNLSQKMDGIARDMSAVALLGAELTRLAEAQAAQGVRLDELEDWRTRTESAAGTLATLWKQLPSIGAVLVCVAVIMYAVLKLRGVVQ